MKTSASIVLFNNEIEILQKAINSILSKFQTITLFLVDNSPNDNLKILANNFQIEYIHNPSNPGFGASHNIAIKKAMERGSNFHFIVNPDVFFEEDVISPMLSYMQSDSSIGMLMPEILNFDGTVQNLPKLLPTPWSIIWRKIKRPAKLYSKFINQYELRTIPRKTIYNAPILSGCFTLLNLELIKEIGMYDDSYFMYFEDWDLSRRMHEKYKTIYFPEVSVYHGYDSGANKSIKLFKIFVKSAIIYFNKWGWIFDSKRKILNKEALLKLE